MKQRPKTSKKKERNTLYSLVRSFVRSRTFSGAQEGCTQWKFQVFPFSFFGFYSFNQLLVIVGPHKTAIHSGNIYEVHGTVHRFGWSENRHLVVRLECHFKHNELFKNHFESIAANNKLFKMENVNRAFVGRLPIGAEIRREFKCKFNICHNQI